MDLSLLSNGEILEIDEHVRRKWSDLRRGLVDDRRSEEGVFDSVSAFVSAACIQVYYRMHSCELGLDAPHPTPSGQIDMAAFIAHFDACLRAVMERMATVLKPLDAKRSQLMLKLCDFAEPRDAWLPMQTIAFVRDFIRVGRILFDE